MTGNSGDIDEEFLIDTDALGRVVDFKVEHCDFDHL